MFKDFIDLSVLKDAQLGFSSQSVCNTSLMSVLCRSLIMVYGEMHYHKKITSKGGK